MPATRARMPLPKNVGEVDHNVRMFLAVPCLVVTATSAIAYHAWLVSVPAAVLGLGTWLTGALRYSPLYHALGVDTDFAGAAPGQASGASRLP